MCERTLNELRECSAAIDKGEVDPDTQVEALWQSCFLMKRLLVRTIDVLGEVSKNVTLSPETKAEIVLIRKELFELPQDETETA